MVTPNGLPRAARGVYFKGESGAGDGGISEIL